MDYIDFTKQDTITQIRMATEIMSTEPFIRQLYDDLCTTIGCYKPTLIVDIYGNMQYIESMGGRWTQPGIYCPPGVIRVALIDLYVTAFDNGKYLGITMDEAYRAEAAHTLLHEISHSMQMTSCIDPTLGAAVEWVNEKHTWDSLYPIVAPMLKKKHKIKIYEQTVDNAVGRVFTYPYKACDDLNAVMNFIISFVWDGDTSVYNELYKEMTDAIDITINLTMYGKDYMGVIIKKDGVINYDNCRMMRNAMQLRNQTCAYKFNLTDLRKDGKHLVYTLDITYPSSREIFYRNESDDFNFNPDYYQ